MNRSFRGIIGCRGGVSVGDSGEGVLDPALMPLTLWYRASYTGTNWTGTTSAGTSDAASKIMDSGQRPDVGSSLNGLTPADFNGTSDFFDAASATYADVFSSSAWWLGLLCWVDTTDAQNNHQDSEAVIGDNQGYLGISVANDGFRVGSHDGALKTAGPVAVTTGEWQWVDAWLSGGTLSIRKNGGTAVTAACGNNSILSVFGVRLGKNWSTAYFDGKIAEVMAMASVPDATTMNRVRTSYVLDRYGLTL